MNRDFKELLSEFNAAKVEYLLVGAHALAVHGHVRATKDLDVWIRASVENAERVMTALRSFGAPLFGIKPEDLAAPDVVFKIGLPPVSIDLLTHIPGLTFEDAWARRLEVEHGGELINVVSREDFGASRRAAGRLQDLADLEQLERIEAAARSSTTPKESKE